MYFRGFALVLLSIGIVSGARAQNPLAASTSDVWKDVEERGMVAARTAAVAATGKPAPRRKIVPLIYRTLELNRPALQKLLEQAPPEFSVPASVYSLEIDVPMPSGKFSRFRIEESPVMEPGLAKKYPQIKTYVGIGIDDPSASMRLDVTPSGFHAIVLSPNGQYFVDPYWADDDTTYIAYFKRDFFAPDKAWTCGVLGKDVAASGASSRPATADRPTGATLRVYRLALGATAEYAAAVSGTNPGTVPQALAAMVTSINRCSAVYEREFAIRFVLVSNTDKLIFTDPATEPYSNSDASSLLTENQTQCDTLIGSANYDIGHVFSTAGGGLAALGVVCRNGSKAQGETGTSNPTGDPYDIDYVVHEMGHQFGANHTFNSVANNCGGGNRNASTAYEPGSGSTIMAYAGICNPQDLAPHSDDYFHTISYDEIDAYTGTGSGSTCPSTISTGNHPPVIAALTNYTIPSQTPFALTASATDQDGDTLTYCWEEFDLGPAQDPTANPRDNGSAPIFRSFDPSPSPTRIFPSLTYILNNQNVPPATLSADLISGEFLPTTSRTMTFRCTVRDNRLNGGGSNYGSVTVTSVSTAGPFVITGTLNASGTIAGGSTQTVTWNVANTSAAPINCANVKISLSTDGGYTFPFVLASSAPNNGSATVTIPSSANVATTQGRIKVEAVGNIFFDISDANLTITSTNNAPTLSINPSGISVARGTPTATVGVVGTASDANGDTLSVSVSNLPGDVSVTPSISGGNVSLSVLANCSIVTTLSSRTYPITLTVTDSKGSTTSGTVNLVITPNPSPTIGTYSDLTIPNTGTTRNVTPSVGPADANNNLLPSPVSVLPTALPGGGTISVNASTGVVSVTTTAASTIGATPVRVTVLDTCGAAAVRIFNVNVISPVPVLSAGTVGPPSTESCLPPNSAVDPGEIVTMSLPINNSGGADTSNLVAALQTSGGVTPLGNPSQNYGDIPATGGTVSRSFQFFASGTCGGSITATLQLQDGATTYPSVTYVIPLGANGSSTSTIQNFDAVTPPALPAGWISNVVSGAGAGAVNWATSSVNPDTAPNSIFNPPIGAPSEVTLTSPSIAIGALGGQLSFKHRWLFESGTGVGYDGGVLEISINGGAFTDIITAGGSFVSGGYNLTISGSFGNVLAGRNAWSGSFDSSYTTTVVNLPAAAAGQNVIFRFRLGTDSDTTPSGAEWRIDTIQLISTVRTCSSCSTAPVFTSSAPPSPVIVGTPYSYTFTAVGNPAPTFSQTGGTLPPGLSLSSAGVLSGTPTAVGLEYYPNITVSASNGVAPAANQTFELDVATRAANYVASFGLSGGSAALTADPDGDGIANLLEYALGLNPTRASGVPLIPVIKSYAGVPYLSITFTRSSAATDVTYTVQASADLQTWTDLATSSGGAATSGPGFVNETGTAPTFTVEVRDVVPVDPVSGPQRFLRLRVTSP